MYAIRSYYAPPGWEQGNKTGWEGDTPPGLTEEKLEKKKKAGKKSGKHKAKVKKEGEKAKREAELKKEKNESEMEGEKERSAEEIEKAKKKIRITSYNVCYTKLLRYMLRCGMSSFFLKKFFGSYNFV